MNSWSGFVVEEIKKTQISVNQVENLIQVPKTHQAKTYTCGVASLQSVLFYYGKEFNQDDLEKALKPDSRTGVDHDKLITFAQEQGLLAVLRTTMSLFDLYKLIDAGKPVIVMLQAWSDKNKKVSESWDEGHYAVVIGYDNDNIYFMDSSTLGNYTFIPVQEFVKRWHDKEGTKRFIHAGIVITSRDAVRYDPDKIKKML